MWAIGSDFGGAPPVILHWDGAEWTQVEDPHHINESTLYAVEAINPNDVWIVGQILAIHWDGTEWTQFHPPKFPYLYDVAAVSSSDVWAVGSFTDPRGQIRPYTMHWDGERWSFVSAPKGAPGANVLYGVTAIASDDVWAVGYQEVSAYDLQPLTEHWDGTAWSVVPAAPPPEGITNIFQEVSAVSPTDIWAVGTYGDQPPTPLLEHWDGAAWSMVDGPPLDGFRNLLYGVSAVSSDDVWAAGAHDPDPYSYRPLALHWDGNSWSEVRAKSPGVNSSFLDVFASSSQDAWGVGAFYDVGTVLKTLTEHTQGCG